MYLSLEDNSCVLLLKNSDIGRIIIRRVVTISPGSSLLSAQEKLLKHNLKRLVVVDSKNHPVGIITEKDIAKAVYTLGDKPIRSVKISGFMSKNLYTVKTNASIYDCAKIMKRHRISSVIVIEDNGVLGGLITKTDIASAFLTQTTAPLKVSKIMTRKVITAMPGDSLLYVEGLLINNKISRVIIQRNRVPVGIITYRDFVPAKLPHWIVESADPKEVVEYKKKIMMNELHVNQMNHLLHFKAVDIMSPNPITIESNEDVGLAVLLMIRNGIGGLPVVKNKKLVGIITKADIVRSVASA